MVAIDFLNHRVVRAKRFTLQIDLLFTAFFNNRAGSGTKGDPARTTLRRVSATGTGSGCFTGVATG
ncbi:hypothetical protein SB359474_3498 [Shigella boydii 3594-74]|uniref:Uncharacterized protein n=2 Tax=Shigella TaxID=620 RepID=A0A6N3R2E0_SHIFL|nr:hypothetical protein SB359474_3498 [Shigella boydii 3594-74]EIQ07193.1 hypothetical protein SFCCH060_3525 [Shigella flexneri CCH060]EIQ34782.1 hypothetical protein SB444474_3365 [Shigella boydii 4444-74]EJZ63525.1 hypothetical protein SF148580_3456 [Shigella flexneri 1485-80]